MRDNAALQLCHIETIAFQKIKILRLLLTHRFRPLHHIRSDIGWNGDQPTFIAVQQIARRNGQATDRHRHIEIDVYPITV